MSIKNNKIINIKEEIKPIEIKEDIIKVYKYVCEECNFKSDIKSRWNQHIGTQLHITGERKKRSDCKDPFKCDKCDYKTKNKTILKQHYLNEHGDIKERKEQFKFYCELCDFGTFSKDFIETHNNSEKHKKHELRRNK
jgi:hypothetical protein